MFSLAQPQTGTVSNEPSSRISLHLLDGYGNLIHQYVHNHDNRQGILLHDIRLLLAGIHILQSCVPQMLHWYTAIYMTLIQDFIILMQHLCRSFISIYYNLLSRMYIQSVVYRLHIFLCTCIKPAANVPRFNLTPSCSQSFILALIRAILLLSPKNGIISAPAFQLFLIHI